jgi:hypothetical protein
MDCRDGARDQALLLLILASEAPHDEVSDGCFQSGGGGNIALGLQGRRQATMAIGRLAVRQRPLAPPPRRRLASPRSSQR